MKKSFLILSTILFLTLGGCKKSLEILDSTNATLSEDSFKNWADARSGRWFSYAVYKAVKDHPEAPKGELYNLVSSYLEPVVNARSYYFSKISSFEEYSAYGDIEDYLAAEYRKNYSTLDSRVNEYQKLDKLYSEFLKLPKVHKVKRTKRFSIRLQMGEIDPVDVMSCGLTFIGDFLLPHSSGFPTPSDYYFFSFYPTTLEEEIEMVIGKLMWLDEVSGTIT